MEIVYGDVCHVIPTVRMRVMQRCSLTKVAVAHIVRGGRKSIPPSSITPHPARVLFFSRNFSDGFGAQVEGQEDDVFGGSGRKKKHGQSRDSSKALGLAMGAVGRSMRGGGGGKSRGKGKRSSR